MITACIINRDVDHFSKSTHFSVGYETLSVMILQHMPYVHLVFYIVTTLIFTVLIYIVNPQLGKYSQLYFRKFISRKEIANMLFHCKHLHIAGKAYNTTGSEIGLFTA